MFTNPFSKRAGAPEATAVAHEELDLIVKNGGCAIIDVREPHEYSAGHIPGAVSLPMSRFDAALLPAGQPIVLVCQSGKRSAHALAQAHAAGRADARHYPGGTAGWRHRGGPLER